MRSKSKNKTYSLRNLPPETRGEGSRNGCDPLDRDDDRDGGWKDRPLFFLPLLNGESGERGEEKGKGEPFNAPHSQGQYKHRPWIDDASGGTRRPVERHQMRLQHVQDRRLVSDPDQNISLLPTA